MPYNINYQMFISVNICGLNL